MMCGMWCVWCECDVCVVCVCVYICVKLLFPRFVLGTSGSHSVNSSLNGVKRSHVEKHGFPYNTAPPPAGPLTCSSKERTHSLPTPGRETGLLRRVAGLALKGGVDWLFGQFGLRAVFVTC